MALSSSASAHVVDVWSKLEEKLIMSVRGHAILDKANIDALLDLIDSYGLRRVAEEWIWEFCLDECRSTHVLNFWKCFDGWKMQSHLSDTASVIETLSRFDMAVDLLLEYLITVTPTCELVGGNKLVERLRKRIVTEVFCDIEHGKCDSSKRRKALLASLQTAIYSRSFAAFSFHKNIENGIDEEEEEEPLMNTEEAAIEFMRFCSTHSKVREAGLLHTVAVLPCRTIANDLINSRIRTHHEDFEREGSLEALLSWIENPLIRWIGTVFGEGNESMKVESMRLRQSAMEAFGKSRIASLFDIIVDFPDSQPALEDLRRCVEATGTQSALVKSLRQAFQARLLHPGANTADIITQYISAIRALRVFDSSGVIMEKVCASVREYLCNRTDTIRCIVTSLTGENSDLAEELEKGTVSDKDGNDEDEDFAADKEKWRTWVPDPVGADPSKTASSRIRHDVITTLVNIYGSKELFVTEYRTLLADRLLASLDYNPNREIRNVELLKLRFGESNLHFCEVMLKDIADSKRVNTYVHSLDGGEEISLVESVQTFENNPINAIILSRLFWPSFREESLRLHPAVTALQQQYSARFTALKAARKLEWKSHLGSVTLTLDFSDAGENSRHPVTFTVSPAIATVIMHYSDHKTWSLDQLCVETELTPHVLRRRIGFWVQHGLLRRVKTDTESYSLIETVDNNEDDDMATIGGEQAFINDREEESALTSTADQKAEEMEVYWSYVVGMLTNLERLPLDRIYNMLTMFVQGQFDCSQQELKTFLDKKITAGLLEVTGGMYSLTK